MDLSESQQERTGGDFGVIHHGQGLTFGLEARDNFLGIHLQLDDLEGDASAHRLVLLGNTDGPATSLAQFLQERVAADGLAHGLVVRVDGAGLSNYRGSISGNWITNFTACTRCPALTQV